MFLTCLVIGQEALVQNLKSKPLCLEQPLLVGRGLVEMILPLKIKYIYLWLSRGYVLGLLYRGCFSRLDCDGLAKVGAGGQRYFLLDTWVAIQPKINSHQSLLVSFQSCGYVLLIRKNSIVCFHDLVSSRCTLRIVQAFFIKKSNGETGGTPPFTAIGTLALSSHAFPPPPPYPSPRATQTKNTIIHDTVNIDS